MVEQQFAHLAIVGRPNVGKSTLLNQLIGLPLSITSSKPQTTRHQILGVVNFEHAQLAVIDTPGWQLRHHNALDSVMRRSIVAAIQQADIVLWVVEAGAWKDLDDAFLALIREQQGSQTTPHALSNNKIVLLINKIDRYKDNNVLLPWLDEIQRKFTFNACIPMSAKRKKHIEYLKQQLLPLLPFQPWHYQEDEFTTHSQKFLVAERLREKVFRLTGDELPFTSTVEIENLNETAQLIKIQAAIVVERDAHKPIVIGKNGEKIKKMATSTRLDLEKLFGKKVFLEVWVKTRSNWADELTSIKAYGYQ